MHFFTAVSAAAALMAGANALFIPRNIHVADFRLYGAEGCHDENEGVWTVIDDDFKNGECKSLNGNVPKSISLTDINKGCTFKLFADDNCSIEGHAVAVGQCADQAAGWKAWSLDCSYKN